MPLCDFNQYKDGWQRWCRGCQAEYKSTYIRSEGGKEKDRLGKIRYMQTPKGKISYAKGHDKYLRNNKDKHYARTTLRAGILSGKIERPHKCSLCETECCPHGHHADYSKPLEVEWLCISCHTEKHMRLKEAA